MILAAPWGRQVSSRRDNEIASGTPRLDKMLYILHHRLYKVTSLTQDNIKFPNYWPFVRGIYRWNSIHITPSEMRKPFSYHDAPTYHDHFFHHYYRCCYHIIMIFLFVIVIIFIITIIIIITVIFVFFTVIIRLWYSESNINRQTGSAFVIVLAKGCSRLGQWKQVSVKLR